MAMFSKKEYAIASIWDLVAAQISCSAELSMKKVITSGPDQSYWSALFVLNT